MENKTPEEILNEFETKSTFILSQILIEQMIIPVMEEYGKQQYELGNKTGYNQGVLDCIENAEVKMNNGESIETDCIFTDSHLNSYEIDEESMKKLLKP